MTKKKRKLSTSRSRTDLITQFAEHRDPNATGSGPWPLANGPIRPTQLRTSSPSVALAAPVPPPPAAGEGDGGFQPAPYKADPDETVTCPECSKLNSPDAKYCDQCGFKLEGASDVTTTASDAPSTPPGTALPAVTAAAPATEAAVPPAADATAPAPAAKSVEPNALCQNGDCGHYGSSHENDSQMGDNVGACAMDGCLCQAMEVEENANSAITADEDDAALAAAGPVPAVADAPIPPGPPATGSDGSEQNPPPPVTGGDSMGPQFTIPVAIIEGQPTGDGREIATGALTWRVPPLPLMGLATETHDPEGFDPNDPAVICGRIDSFERVPGEGSTQLILARGYYLPNDDGMYFAELNEAMGRMGVSADVAVSATEITVGDVDADGWPTDMAEILTEGTIMGLTVCPYPAFEGAYIVLGDGSESPAAQPIPQQADEDAPMVPDTSPAAVVAGGQLIHFLTYEECVPCDQGLEVVVASGAGPTRPPAAWFADPHFQLEDGRLMEILDRRGQRAMGGKYACPVTVEDSGRVYGHIAPWGICHTGSGGQCILAPKSGANYAHFKRGQHIVTAEGEKVRVGVLTADTGHASIKPGVTAASAMAHYDNTALAVADVNIGEDEYGIWIAGAIRPDATDEQIRKLTASSISGDWRNLGGQLELVAALAVNQPGFPLAVVASGEIQSLVASGGATMHALKNPPAPIVASGDTVLRAALGPMLSTAKSMAKERLAALGS